MARKFVVITLILWLLLFMFGNAVRTPRLALYLYGLYTGEASSGEATYYPTLMHGWAIGMGVVFVTLAIVAFQRAGTAGIAFMVLFLLSGVVCFVRLMEGLRGLH